MSGGSHDYTYLRFREYYEDGMYDAELNDLITALAKVLHDLEWWQSGDISEDGYRETVAKFKKKWFGTNREERLKGYVDERIEKTQKELYELLGVGEDEERNAT